MNTLKKMRWGNAFSYGPSNEISFVDSPITQLVGSNGHGKSSIALILEECLYNKNSKGVKKGDILNRYTDAKKYWIEVTFDADGKEYVVYTERSNTTQSVKLTCEGVDISGHTSTSTYKAIEELLGMDHKTFAQLVYQSHAGSLEFLTATDSVRKKFLTELLGLDKYVELGEKFKNLSAKATKEVDKVQSQIDVLEKWVAKYSKDPLQKKLPKAPLLDVSEELTKELGKLEHELENITSINEKIANNNIVRARLAAVKIPEHPGKELDSVDFDLTTIKQRKAVLEAQRTTAEAFHKKIHALHGTCPTCTAEIDPKVKQAITDEKTSEIAALDKEISELTATIRAQEASNKANKAMREQYATDLDAYNAAVTKKELLESKLDPKLPETPQTEDDYKNKVKALKAELKQHKADIQEIVDYNTEVEVYNAKIQTILDQLAERTEEINTLKVELAGAQNTSFNLSVLAKAFSNNGLVAYKIESLIKDLEDITNEYLMDLSDGRFVISFVVSASDKLNVVINDNGKTIDISSLSGGERARVNAATLLSIRRLMQSLSGSRINLLILDETIEAMDQHGKEKLIEVLLKQEHLNTFIVSHGFTHPLLDKIFITKQQNQSRLER